MIYVSTGGYETACEFFESNISNCELSGGLFQENIKELLINLKSKGNIQLHNYFPPPKKPFVMNLASSDPIINKITSVKGLKLFTRVSLMSDVDWFDLNIGIKIVLCNIKSPYYRNFFNDLSLYN